MNWYKTLLVSPLSLQQRARQLAASLPPQLLSRRLATLQAEGSQPLAKGGVGEEFWQYRPYSPGEDASRIDWRRSARGDALQKTHYYVREREVQYHPTCSVVVDTSDSMQVREQGEHLVSLTTLTVLAYAQQAAWHTKLQYQRQAALDILPGQPLDVWAGNLQRNQQRNQQRGKVDLQWLITDALQPIEQLKRGFQGGNAQRKILFLLTTQQEQEFTFQGRVKFMTINMAALAENAESWREEYLQQRREHFTTVNVLAAQYGWQVVVHTAESDLRTSLLAAFQQQVQNVV